MGTKTTISLLIVSPFRHVDLSSRELRSRRNSLSHKRGGTRFSKKPISLVLRQRLPKNLSSYMGFRTGGATLAAFPIHIYRLHISRKE